MTKRWFRGYVTDNSSIAGQMSTCAVCSWNINFVL